MSTATCEAEAIVSDDEQIPAGGQEEAEEGREERRPRPPGEVDAATERAVLHHLLFLHPVQLTMEEVVREVGGQFADFDERDAIASAVRDLAGAGLVHCHGDFVLPSRAALRFNELDS